MSVSELNNARKHIKKSRKNTEIGFGTFWYCNIRQSDMKYFSLSYWDMSTFLFQHNTWRVLHAGPQE